MRIGIAFLFIVLLFSTAVAAGIYLLARLSQRSASDQPEA